MCCDNCGKCDSKYCNCEGDKLCQICAKAWRAERSYKTEHKDNGNMRTFDSGAVRDTSVNKLDYEACLSPLVLKRYAEYVRSCRVQSDGKIRADDNWQKGFGLSVWMKSKWRHLIMTWRLYREDKDLETNKEAIIVSLCAEFFNTHGMLHEILANKMKGEG